MLRDHRMHSNQTLSGRCSVQTGRLLGEIYSENQLKSTRNCLTMKLRSRNKNCSSTLTTKFLKKNLPLTTYNSIEVSETLSICYCYSINKYFCPLNAASRMPRHDLPLLLPQTFGSSAHHKWQKINEKVNNANRHAENERYLVALRRYSSLGST